MRVLSLQNNCFNIQKCFLPDSEFSRVNNGMYCYVNLEKSKLLVKIGLWKEKNIDDTVLLDGSVSVFFSFEKICYPTSFCDITLQDFTILGEPRPAKTVYVTLVLCDIFSVKKYNNNNDLAGVVKNILKFYVFSPGSFVSLNNLKTNQKFDVCYIVIENVKHSKSNDVFRIDTTTEVVVNKCISLLKFEQGQQKENQIRAGGCSKIYSILKEALEFSKSSHMKNIKLFNKLLLLGPPGCGKTTIVRNVTSDCECMLLEITATNINTLTPDKVVKKFKNIFAEAKILAENNECCVILIKNIDLMSSGKSFQTKKFVGELILLLESIGNTQRIVVIATTNNPKEVDSQLRKPNRLEDELEIMVPTAEEREDIVRNILLPSKISLNKKLSSKISSWTPGFVGADLRLLIVEALMIYLKREPSTIFNETLLEECFEKALTKVIPSALRGTIGLCTSNSLLFSQIGGLENIKKILDLSVKQQLENPDKFEKFGIPLTKGILLYGPPGCAKTTLVKALSKECNATFLATSAADLYSPFVGDAEKTIVQLFSQARVGSPSILFIDEIDAVVGSKSGDRERGVQERILSTLLVEMDGVGISVNSHRNNSLSALGESKKETVRSPNSGVIVIGATNRPQLLDDALKRPGRFDRLLYVPPPNEEERLRILAKLTEKMSLCESVDLKCLAKKTNFYSGADLKNICQEAGLHALRCTNMSATCITQSHFEYVINEYKPSLNEKVIGFYESFQKYNI